MSKMDNTAAPPPTETAQSSHSQEEPSVEKIMLTGRRLGSQLRGHRDLHPLLPHERGGPIDGGSSSEDGGGGTSSSNGGSGSGGSGSGSGGSGGGSGGSGSGGSGGSSSSSGSGGSSSVASASSGGSVSSSGNNNTSLKSIARAHPVQSGVVLAAATAMVILLFLSIRRRSGRTKRRVGTSEELGAGFLGRDSKPSRRKMRDRDDRGDGTEKGKGAPSPRHSSDDGRYVNPAVATVLGAGRATAEAAGSRRERSEIEMAAALMQLRERTEEARRQLHELASQSKEEEHRGSVAEAEGDVEEGFTDEEDLEALGEEPLKQDENSNPTIWPDSEDSGQGGEPEEGNGTLSPTLWPDTEGGGPGQEPDEDDETSAPSVWSESFDSLNSKEHDVWLEGDSRDEEDCEAPSTATASVANSSSLAAMGAASTLVAAMSSPRSSFTSK